MEAKLSEAEIRAIAVEVARILRDDGTAAGADAKATRQPARGAGRGTAAAAQDEPKARASRVLDPEQAVAEFPSLTVRTIKRAITEGRLEPSEPGQTTVRRTELKRFVASRG